MEGPTMRSASASVKRDLRQEVTDSIIAAHLMVVGMRKGYEDPRWLTYHQAQENGWQVRRGEKGTQIEFWQFPDARHSAHEESRDDASDSRRDHVLYRVYTVFNARQIDGIPAHHAPRLRQEWETLEAGEAILRHSGARISHDQA